MAFMFEKLEVCQNAVTLADDQAFPRSADLTLEICLLFEVHITRAPRDPIHKPPKCLDFLNIGAGEEPGLETTFLGSPGRWPLNDSPDSWREPRLKNPGQDVVLAKCVSGKVSRRWRQRVIPNLQSMEKAHQRGFI